VKTTLKGKGKAGNLTDDPPDEKIPTFKKWDEEDSAIMSWLWSSMTEEISDNCMFLGTTKNIWKSLEESYSKAKDATQIYDVKVKTMGAKQGNKTITQYANHLKTLWMELDQYRVIKAKCSEDTTTLMEYIEQDKVQILGQKTVRGINEVVATVSSEESRRGLMLAVPPIVESSSMLAEKSSIVTDDLKKGEGNYVEKKGEELFCTFL